LSSSEQLEKTLALIKLERQADLDYYRQKVLLRSLQDRTREGTTWYPVRLKRDYIGTGERLIIEVERTSHLEKPHAFQSGKSVSIFSNNDGKPERDHVNGVINYVKENLMVVTLNADELPDWIDENLLGVDVMFDEMSYREMEFALREVIKAENNRLSELREILLAKGKPASKTIVPYTVPNLNLSQIEALQTVIAARDVAFIHGPPGTGKTTTLVETIAITLKDERQVLVCAPSNAAVDLLADKLSEKGLSVLRIGHPARVTEQTLSKTLDARISDHPAYKELRVLRKKMEQLKGTALKFKKHFGHHERQQRKQLLQESKALKADADMLEFYIVNDLLQTMQVVCCTLVGSSHPVLRGKQFKTAFIDEAAQALEPATWIPLMRTQRVIFAGDHQQLPPTIKSVEAARMGLSATLFEKGIARHPNMAVMLQVQYRMHQDIMKFPSSYFYEDSLLADDSVSTHLLQEDEQPVEFIDTAGCGYTEQQDPETLSRFNEEEASLLMRQAETLVERIGTTAWLDNRFSFGIITPYRAQVDFLNKLLDASAMLEPVRSMITVNTVDAFQGQERDVIAISFVRSNDQAEVGFLSDIRRTNVAMTRARKKLIMIGDSATLAANPFYNDLIEFVQQKGYYKSAFEIISN
jgi:superfamily I DNA and/or RNA helicase